MRFATSFKANAQAAWSANSVLRILKNPVYIGVLTQGKETTPSYKVRKRIIKPEDEWTVIPDSHEPIIRREDFESVQKVLTLDTRRSPNDSNVQLFSGMVFCGECGASMVRKTVPSGNKKYVYYVCSAHKQDKSCASHGMRDTALEEVVLETVKQYIRDVIDLDDILSMTDTAPLRTAEAQKVQRQLDKKRSEHERLQKLLRYISACKAQMDEANALEKIRFKREKAEVALAKDMAKIQALVRENAYISQDQQVYRQRFEEMSEQIEKQKNTIAELQEQELRLVGVREKLYRFIEALESFDAEPTFDSVTWNALVERVLVNPKSLIFEFKNGEKIKITI